MDRRAAPPPPPPSLSGASSSPRCRFGAAWRALGRGGATVAAALRRALGALLTFAFAVVGSLVGIFIGAFMGMSTESGMLRGAGVGAVSGAVFSIEAVESCIEIWRSTESGKYSFLFVLDIISSLFSGRIVWEKVSPALQRAVQSQMSLMSTPFIDNNDLFETGCTGGMSAALINKIPAIRFSAATDSAQETDRTCCSVCLQLAILSTAASSGESYIATEGATVPPWIEEEADLRGTGALAVEHSRKVEQPSAAIVKCMGSARHCPLTTMEGK
ncbi:NEP1-interacting protein 2-like [Hordeum vulgare]|nr:NEP1-interacting protein 2-like [Hordeum vulgare]